MVAFPVFGIVRSYLHSGSEAHRNLPGALRVVALAASAGGLAALSRVLSELPAGFSYPVVVVQHLDPHHRSWMPEILQRRVALQVEQVRGGETLAPGTIYLAPPDRHVLVGPDGILKLDDGARVNFSRPSADRLFFSLAESVGERAVAVVLSGSGCDGARGIAAVKDHGGMVIVQDEGSSEFFGMPGAAQATGAADLVLPLAAIGAVLVGLAGSAGSEGGA